MWLIMAVMHTTCQNKTLLHVLVTSRLDYCDALLLYNLIILSKDYNVLWTQRPKLSLESESLTNITMMTMIMLHHYLLSYTGFPSVSVLF